MHLNTLDLSFDVSPLPSPTLPKMASSTQPPRLPVIPNGAPLAPLPASSALSSYRASLPPPPSASVRSSYRSSKPLIPPPSLPSARRQQARTSVRFSTYSVAPSFATTVRTTDSAHAEIRDIETGLTRLENKALSQQRVVLSEEKSANLSKLALGAKLERALDRRMRGQDAEMRPRKPQPAANGASARGKVMGALVGGGNNAANHQHQQQQQQAGHVEKRTFFGSEKKAPPPLNEKSG